MRFQTVTSTDVASALVSHVLLVASPADTPSQILESWLWNELVVWGVTVPVFEALFDFWLVEAANEHGLNEKQGQVARQLALRGFIGSLDELVAIAKVLQT